MHASVDEWQSPQTIVDAFRKAMENTIHKVRGLLFCNPHNPWGHICTVEVIDALLVFCEQADLHFVSDEIYALSTFGRTTPSQSHIGSGKRFLSPVTEFVSVLSRDLEKLRVDGRRVHLLYSISKDFGCSGLRFVRLYPKLSSCGLS